MAIDVSVILPVFNASGTLREAVGRLLEQRNVSFEIVIVDDGSTDGTRELALRLSGEYDRVRAFALAENAGVAVARERAAAESRGEFLWFVDDDDEWETDALESMLGAARAEDADVVVAGATYVYPTGMPGRAVGDPTLAGVFDGRRALQYFLTGRISGHLWNKLFRRALVDHIDFTRVKVHSDQAMVAQLLSRARRVVAIETPVYRYLIRSGSIVRSGTKRSESLFAVGQVVEAAAREVRPALHESPEFIYYRQRFIVASALKDAVSGAYPLDTEKRLVEEACRHIGLRGLLTVARQHDARRFALLLAARIDRRLLRRIVAIGRSTRG